MVGSKKRQMLGNLRARKNSKSNCDRNGGYPYETMLDTLYFPPFEALKSYISQHWMYNESTQERVALSSAAEERRLLSWVGRGISEEKWKMQLAFADLYHMY